MGRGQRGEMGAKADVREVSKKTERGGGKGNNTREGK